MTTTTTTETYDFEIRTLSVIDGQPNQAGNRLIATFNLTIAGLYITGCILIEKADGICKAAGPSGKHKTGGSSINTRIADPELEREITRRACKVYTIFTGREVESE